MDITDEQSWCSPGAFLRLELDCRGFPGVEGCPCYRLVAGVAAPSGAGQEKREGRDKDDTFQEQVVLVDWSRLGLHFKEIDDMASSMQLECVETFTVNEPWDPVYGSRSVIPNEYTGVLATFKETGAPSRRFQVEFRLYDSGLAFRYLLREHPGDASREIIVIAAEATQFHVNEECMVWEEHGTEGEYKRVPVTEMMPWTQRPLTVEDPSGMFMSITEAGSGNLDGAIGGAAPCMFISPVDEESPILVPEFGGESGTIFKRPGTVRTRIPYSSSWRVIIVAKTPGGLLEGENIILSLNPPPAIPGPQDWIRPGKVMREVTLSNRGAMECIEFCARHGLQYIEFDAGWYGDEYNDESNARTAITTREESGRELRDDWDGLDIPMIVQRAREKGIGVWLYVNRRVIERQLDELLPLYREWGIVGLKFGFVTVGTQEENALVLDAVRKCARYKLMVDIHDEYRPTGFSRTYPNLLTQEGVRGNEHMPTPRHYCTLPFTRNPAGPADVTVCYYNERMKTTRAHQLAHPIVFYSPLHFLFWYDTPDLYKGDAEIELFEKVPTTWDDTIVLHGEIGEHVCVARRKGREWFIGAITNEIERQLPIKMDFLEPGVEYDGTVYINDGAMEGGIVNTRTGVAIHRMIFSSGQEFQVNLVAAGGCSIHLRPRNGQARLRADTR